MSLFGSQFDEHRLTDAIVRAANAFADYYEERKKNLERYQVKSLKINGKEYDPEPMDATIAGPPVAEPDTELNNSVSLGVFRSKK